MAVYTVLVKTIAEQMYMNLNHTSDTDILKNVTPDAILDAVWNQVIPLNLPPVSQYLPDKEVVKAICRHYWMREIGMETVGLWKFSITTRLIEILPKYREMAKAQAEMGSIWENSSWNKTHSGKFSTNRDMDETTEDHDTTTENDISVKTNVVTRDRNDKTDREKQGSTTRDDMVIYGKTEKSNGTLQSATSLDQTNTNDLTDTSNTVQSFTQDHKENGTGSTTTLDTTKDKFSDTPQNGLVSVESGNYLTNYRAVDKDNIVNGENSQTLIANDSGTSDVTDKHTGTVKTDADTSVAEETTGAVTFGGTDTKTGTDKVSGTELETLVSTNNENGKENLDLTRSGSKDGRGSKNVTDNESGTDSYTDKYAGYDGDKVENMYKYSQMYVSIYQMIIGEVAGFFMSVLG